MTHLDGEQEGVMLTASLWVWICKDGIIKLIPLRCVMC